MARVSPGSGGKTITKGEKNVGRKGREGGEEGGNDTGRGER